MKKALVLSGGGSKGAYVGGMLEYMKLVMKKDYDLYVSTSTGSLLQTLTSINDFKSLKKGYTEIGLDDIYSISPFKKNKGASINLWSAIRMILFKKKPTIGETENLKKLINKLFPEEKYQKSLELNKEMVTCVTNLSKVREEYYSSKDLGLDNYDKFCDWTWISANAVPFTSLVRRGEDNDYYADGGFMEHVPIKQAIKMGATEIDVISTKTKKYQGDTDIDFGNNPLKLINRMFDVMLRETADRDIEAAKQYANDKKVKINMHYLPRNLTEDFMVFNKSEMLEWWSEGYNYMKNNHQKNKKYCETIEISPKK